MQLEYSFHLTLSKVAIYRQHLLKIAKICTFQQIKKWVGLIQWHSKTSLNISFLQKEKNDDGLKVLICDNLSLHISINLEILSAAPDTICSFTTQHNSSNSAFRSIFLWSYEESLAQHFNNLGGVQVTLKVHNIAQRPLSFTSD